MGATRSPRMEQLGDQTAATAATGPTNDDIKWALDEFGKRRQQYIKLRGYYNGDGQERMITTEQLKTLFANMFQDFRVNYCRAVVDAVADRLQINSFSAPDEEPEVPSAIEAATAADVPTDPMTGGVDMSVIQDPSARQLIAKLEGQLRTLQRQQQPPVTPPSAEATEEAPEEGASEELPEQDAAQEAWDIWEANRMQRRAGHIHQEAIATGDAYVLIWPGPDGEPVIYPQSGHEIAVDYDKDRPGTIKKAAKFWKTKVKGPDGKDKDGYRMTLYYPDRVEKWAAIKADSGAWPKQKDFQPYMPEGEEEGWQIRNQYAEVPIFHFANNADLQEYGRSELTDAVPIQDYINRSLWNLLAGDEAQGFPQRWALNIEDPREDSESESDRPIPAGVSRMLALVGGDREGSHPPQIGQFPAADLNQMANVTQHGAQQMAVATGTPIHHFMPTLEGPSTPASGESQKTSDGKLQNKVEDRQISFGDTWAKAMEFAVRVRRNVAPGDVKLDTNWKDLRPRNEQEMWQIAQLKQQAGVPWQQILEEMGYTPEQIAKFERIKEQNAAKFAQAPVGGALGPQGQDVEKAAQERTAQQAAKSAAEAAVETSSA